MQKLLLILGAVIIALGLLWPTLSKFPFGKLPSDFSMKIGNAQVFFPLKIYFLLSILLSVVFKFFR